MTDQQGKIHLVLFFTRGVSLQTWEHVGMFSREVALYQRFQREGVRVTFVTYGNRRDLEFAKQIPGIDIRCNRWGLPQRMYENMLPWLHGKVIASADLIKTNQTNGASLALRVARIFNKPLIARCGYLWSDFVARQRGIGSIQVKKALEVEKKVFSSSDRIIVTTEAMNFSILDRFPSLENKITIIPNYVDVETFAPHTVETSRAPKICFIGRLDQNQKNLLALLEAVRELEVEVYIIGEGALRPKVEEEARHNPLLHLVGRIPHGDLPQFLDQNTIFILPSFYEGHPKTLIEAMSCGLPVIGTDVPGINNLITHGETGWLCNTDAVSLRDGILKVLSDSDLRERLGQNARKYVLDKFALSHTVRDELNLYRGVLGGEDV